MHYLNTLNSVINEGIKGTCFTLNILETHFEYISFKFTKSNIGNYRHHIFNISSKSCPQATKQIYPNVLTHVLLHETAHALLKEFDIPILGNKENIADSFATNYTTQHLRDDAVDIITDRAKSLIYEDSQATITLDDHKGEHELDIRRAYRAMCLLYGADPADWADATKWANFSQHDLNNCSDLAPQITAGWEKTLMPLYITSKPSKNIAINYQKSPYKKALQKSKIFEKIATHLRKFNWPNKITLVLKKCNGGAYWSRSKRSITLCDQYIVRFLNQSQLLK